MDGCLLACESFCISCILYSYLTSPRISLSLSVPLSPRQDADLDRRDERKVSHLLPARHDRNTSAEKASTVWHGKQEDLSDYQGRSWLEPPRGTRGLSSEGDEVHDCFIPKKLIHRFTGHSKGVQAIRWFPDTGHLLLSASYDGKVKIWDSHNSRKVRRTYQGHSQAVRDVNFSHDGRHFITASFDRYVLRLTLSGWLDGWLAGWLAD